MKKKIFSLVVALMTIALGAQAASKNGHEYVDLGLPSGTLWATCNIGSETFSDLGDKFLWGETEPWTGGNIVENYKFGSRRFPTKYSSMNGYGYNDNKVELDDTDDAAQVNWGGNWRMPTQAQLTELNTYCDWSLSSINVGDYDIYGLNVKSKQNGNSIFLPLTKCVAGKDPACATLYATKNRVAPFDDVIVTYGARLTPNLYMLGGEDDRFQEFYIRPVFIEGTTSTHTHSYATEWRKNANTHWHVCESSVGVCDNIKKNEASHTFDSNNTCTVCGYSKKHIHEYSDEGVVAELYYDENTHWYACEYPEGTCNAPKKNEAVHSFAKDGVCKCGYKVNITHTHNYATTWSNNEGGHWHVCTSTVGTCNAPKANYAAHTFGADNTCTVCGYSKGATTKTISNIPSGWKVNGQTPTSGSVSVKVGDAVTVTPANIPSGKKIKSIKAVKKQ